MQSTIAIVLVLGGLIFFHELGHFLVARALGIGVKVFSLGFGPKLAGFSRGKTRYQLSLVPLGGYVQLAGESPEQPLPEEFAERESFTLRPSWQRMLVVAAGPIFNLVLAWFIYSGLFLVHGQMELLPVVGQVNESTPAERAGIRSGDRVLEVDGNKIEFWQDMAGSIRESGGRTLLFKVVRDREVLDLKIQPEMRVQKNIFGEDVEIPLIGVTASGETIAIPLHGGSAAWAGLVRSWDVISLTAQGIMKLVGRVIPFENVGGPILIAQLISKQTEQGLSSVLALAAIISINLGLLNLLPIPVLDGGHIIFYALETIFRRPVNRRVQEITTKVGLILLITLFALVLYNDLQRLLL
jgi:regulator of sigma E protease